ncbi:MAG: DUF4363 family protein [Clostridia bacterium]|nr:DUF4363 family protein [Clostridia bacterium]
MKRCFISMLAALLLSLGICLGSFLFMRHVAEEIEAMRTQILRLAESGDEAGARERMTQMAEMWEKHEPLLEAISPHDTLHAVTELIIEADANLNTRDIDDFNRSMMLLGMAIEHLYMEERLRPENIL